jgi:hypothetical protein
MGQRTTFASFVLFGVVAVQVVAAAEIKQRSSEDAETTAIQLSGRIERGDLLSLQALISKLPQTRLITIHLDSTAGFLEESMALGRFFHQAKIRTVVGANPAKCNGMCALAFLGGRDALTNKPWRVKTSSGQLAFSSLRSTAPEKPEYTDKDMTSAIVNTQRAVLQIADYIQDIRDELTFLQLIFKRSDRNLNFVSNEQALQLGIYVLDERTGEMINPKVIVDRLR